ncbi:chemotaxis protein [Halobacillus halophilus]|uniref:chemotaxis protein n=1 Tax=Halobacillus halophilus TaxID=1570 RepID=UPI001CD544AC|nr:chemotaxis protein [Halobacillus halophilus]MCA1012601.1 chemotaxis protein [Halobacillus halophilus]
MENQQGILLESGINELEIVEFGIGSNRFGINVIKVKEILNPLPITPIPHSHPSVEGIIEVRGEVVPVVDTAHALGFDPSKKPAQDKFILAEFNQMKIVFHVHTVTQIHRISWEQMEKPKEMYQGLETKITGIVKMEGGMLLLLDFEKVAADINPEASITKEQLRNLGERERSEKRIMVVEDSSLLRELLQETLEEAGYDQTVVFQNGKEALDHLKQLVDEGKEVEEEYQLVITDIEMPQIDGHHLTRVIKESEEMSSLPVIIFSSLITRDLRHKGEKVGADAQVSKPEILNLVKWIDHYIL